MSIPGQGLTVLCGISGSGKSTLLQRVIHESAVAGRPVNCSSLSGLDQFRHIHFFTPSNRVRHSAERLADFLGMTAFIYDAFVQAAGKTAASSRLKKALKTRSKVSFCSHCDGKGEWTTDLDYLGSFVETCTYCQGSGLAAELCLLKLQGKSLADVLTCDVDELPDEIITRCKLSKVASYLQEFALGYLSLGRHLYSLSEGELQRLRLARLFLHLQDEPCLLLLDEPDSGLSFGECRQLLQTMRNQLSKGHAAIVISHHPLLMCQADYLVDLGPGAGTAGGKLTACGPPHELLTGNWPLSKTAAYLRQLSGPDQGST